MALETATNISELDPNNPVGADFADQGDNHIRMLKTCLQAVFPNASRAFRFPTTVAGQTSDVNVVVTDQNKVFPVSALVSARTVNLPAMSAALDGFEVLVFKSDSSANIVTVDGNGADILNSGTTLILRQQWEGVRLVWCQLLGQWFAFRNCPGNGALIGEIKIWPLATIPTGYLICDGSLISRSTYAALFGAISTTYGVGDGVLTFALPNYKDYFLRGFDAVGTNVGTRTDRGDGTAGAVVGSKQEDEVEAHTHGPGSLSGLLPDHKHGLSGDADLALNQSQSGGSANSVTTGQVETGNPTANPAVAMASGVTASTGGTETRPKNVTVNFIIYAGNNG